MALKANFLYYFYPFLLFAILFFVFALGQTRDGTDFHIFTISVLLALIVFLVSILFDHNFI